ncbi:MULTISPECIES: type VII secretion protein EccCb [unclassified Nocardia]|uniref:type VII secretion protein EccCb n=1 Tax=unclassified Nocardia TaxID=2637762 RepID=UPI001CE3C003|nr:MULTISPECIES: type VII secretion protein EccCb [unclassified Nocardia]
MTSPPGRRIALFVANDVFHSPDIARLYAPVSDARELRNLLRDPEIGAFQPAEMLVNESKAEIERSIERMFRSAGPQDLVLFYYSGHGFRTSRNLYLATSNTDPNLPSSSAVSSSFVKELIRESDAAAKIILLDCCYSGAFLGNDVIKAAGGVDDGVGEHLVTGDGICVMTACTGVQQAEDGNHGGTGSSLSVFTAAIVNGITTGLADTGTGRISTHDLWTYVSDEVRRNTDRQTPSLYGVLNDEVYLARTRRETSGAGAGDRIRLGGLLGRLEEVSGSGLRAESWWGTGKLAVPIGRQRRADGSKGDIVRLDLAGADNNLLVVGRAGSGKSTMLRTLVAALVLTHSTDDARVYVLESSNRLGSMRELPHIARVVGDDEPDQVNELLGTMVQEIFHRKRLYRMFGIDSPSSLRAARRTLPEGPVPDLFLIIDRWGDFAEPHSGTADLVRQIADQGREYAVHVVATARDWNEVPGWLVDLLPAHLELRLHRPNESRIDPERAQRLPDGPGWAMFGQRLFRVAVPDIREPPADSVLDDEMTDGAADLVARLVGRISVDAAPGPAADGIDADFAALYGINDAFDVGSWWRDRPMRDRLRIKIGRTGARDPVELDLKPAADGGMGSHGLVVGAIGSGKSELLRTIVLGLALTHSPAQVNFLLVDFHGGATFQPFAGLPHIAGHVRDVEQDLSLPTRLQEVLEGEIERRGELLRAAGHLTTIDEYERARAAGAPLDPLPTLFVVIEDFVELLSGTATFADLLIQIGRIGRSLGLHLLLGAQRPDEWRLRGLDSYLSYRIALRTFSAAESRLVLGTTDAYHLPRTPGYGYLKTAAGTTTRFRAAYASGPTDSGAGQVDRPLTESVAAALSGFGPRAHRLWQAPLDTAPTLGMVLAEADSPPLRVPVGVVDRPRLHRRDTLLVDLDAGQVAVVGGPRSGKTTALLTLILAVAATRTPEQAQFYCLDFGGGLSALTDLPHVGSMAGRRDADRVRRTVAELDGLLREREKSFREMGLESMAEYRRLGPVDRYGDVFLVVDGFDVVHQDYPVLEQTITTVAAQGLPYGIHVIVTLSPWSRVRLAQRGVVGTRIELRLGDPADSQLDRQAAGLVPADRPGRGLAPEKLHMLIALPRLDAVTDPQQLSGGVAAAVRQLCAEHGARRAPQVRLLPAAISRDEVLALAHDVEQDATHVVIGLDDTELRPVALDFDARSHLMVFGDAFCGKTTVLQDIVAGITENSTPAQARILLIDYRRTLLGAVEQDRLISYCAAASAVPSEIRELSAFLAKRVPGASITPDQLHERDWWHGPEIYVLVDDHDLVASGGDDPLEPLLEFLPMAHDIGLHLVIARRATGLSRALTGSVLGRLRDISADILLMNTPADEGKALGEFRPTPLPPGRAVLLTRARDPQLIQIAQPPAP